MVRKMGLRQATLRDSTRHTTQDGSVFIYRSKYAVGGLFVET